MSTGINYILKGSIAGIMIAMLSVFTACSGSSDGTDDPAVANVTNINSNLANPNPVVHRLEFPRLKGGQSLVITHFENGEVNYSVEWDTVKRSNRWSAYELYASNRVWNPNVPRYTAQKGDPQYPTDPDFHCSTAWTTDNDPFWGSGYFHGHICPSADRRNTKLQQYQTFYLTNIMPQNGVFNAGVWETMEKWVRSQISIGSKDTLYVVKGGTIDNPSQYKAQTVHGMIIPNYYYMALLMKNSKGYRAMGFWIKHEANIDTSLAKYVVNIDTLEERTGIDFFCNLPDDIENHVESLPLENVLRAWGFN